MRRAKQEITNYKFPFLPVRRRENFMNARDDAKLKSFRLIESVCTANQTIVATNVAFQTALGEFKTKVARFAELAQKDDVPLTGITSDKKKIRAKLCENAAEQAALIYAYAATIGSDTLKAQVAFPKSALARLRDEELAPHCQNIHDAGTENLAALTDYGVTTATLANLQINIDDFSEAALKPRTAGDDRKINNKNIAQLVREISELLEIRMDRLALTFKTSHPEFYAQYAAAHRLEKPPVTHTQLKITVTDKQTHTPIKNAQITATPQDPDDPPLTAATDTEGIAHFNPIPYGDYDITITATGYLTYETEAEAVMGEINELEAQLEK